MKTLYVSDLDGTLLRSNETTAEYTNNVTGEVPAANCFDESVGSVLDDNYNVESRIISTKS